MLEIREVAKKLPSNLWKALAMGTRMVTVIILVLPLTVLASGECSKYEIDGSDAKRSQRLLEAIKKLNEVENVLLGELLTTNSRAPAMNETCGGEGE